MSLKKDTTKLKLEDLKVGMFIEDWHQLEDIYGVYIYLNGYEYKSLKGEILYLCKEPDEFVSKLSKEKGGLYCYYMPEEANINSVEVTGIVA